MSMMHEAVDYNALSWVRQEIDVTLRHACDVLMEYSGRSGHVDLLNDYAELLHQVRGPLQIAELAGADMLVAEMELVVSGLHHYGEVQHKSALEILLKSMQDLPVYLSRLQSSADDSPELVLPLVGLLRSVASPMDCHAANSVMAGHPVLPPGVFINRQAGSSAEIASRAHSARVRFQSALLEWYRGGPEKKGVAALADVLGKLQEDAASESEARLWWVGAGVADALGAGLLPDSKETKQLFGQLDRQIKRLVEGVDVDFNDAQSHALLDGLLNSISCVEADEGRLAIILSTYDSAVKNSDQDVDLRIAEHPEPGAAPHYTNVIAPGVGSEIVAGLASGSNCFVDADPASQEVPVKAESMTERGAQFLDVLKGISLCKDAVEECLNVSMVDGPMLSVTDVLDGVCRGLRGVDLGREAEVIACVQAFIESQFLKSMQIPDEALLMRLADAICGVEFYVECLRDGRIFGSRIIEIAESAVADIGFPVHKPGVSTDDQTGCGMANEFAENARVDTGRVCLDPSAVAPLQVIDPNADEEILGIFIDESVSALHSLRESVSKLDGGAISSVQLEEISRVFHTLKGNSRMLGAQALGEFAHILEDLVNNAMNAGASVYPALGSLLNRACDAVSQLIDQVKDPVSAPEMNIDSLVSEVIRLNHGAVIDMPGPITVVNTEKLATCVDAESAVSNVGLELPVLAADADPEIIDIFIDEAGEVVAELSEIIPTWVAAPENTACISEIRRCMHTIKGSGRVAGALFMGEFAWAIEDLLNRVIDGTIRPDDEIFSLVKKLPAVLQLLTGQIRDGAGPTEETRLLMTAAAALRCRVCGVEYAGDPDSQDGQESGDAEEYVSSVQKQDVSLIPVIPESECSIMQIYTSECRDILHTIRKYLDTDSVYGMVTEPLYRALHTLAGISESAEVGCIARLATELDKYFGNMYHMHNKISSTGLDVLSDSTDALALLVEKMPDASSEAGSIDKLCERIAALCLEGGQAADTDSAHPEACLEDTQAGVPVHAINDAGKDAHQADDFANVDQELFEIFLEEAAEIQDASERVLHAWAAAPENHDGLAEYQRYLHTLKGSARMMNITAIGDLSHSLETLLTRVAENTVTTSDGLFSALFVAQDQLTEMLEQVRLRQMPDACVELEATLLELLHIPSSEPELNIDSSINEGVETAGDIESADSNAVTEVVDNTEESPVVWAEDSDSEALECSSVIESDSESSFPDESILLPVGQHALSEQLVDQPVFTGVEQEFRRRGESSAPLRQSGGQLAARKQNPARKRGEHVKVQSELLDDLVNYSGEINIYRSRMESQIGDYRFNLGELEQTINRLREQLRKLEMETEAQVLYRYAHETDRQNQEFDPLELDRYSTLQESSRSLMESIGDLYSLLSLMENTTRDSEKLLLQQSRVSADLHEGLMRTRMTPFAGLETRLKRIVRQSARQLEKKVELELLGADGEMDRAVIERIIAPLEHMLRNAVAHGIELPDERIKKGKDEAGGIIISFNREGPDIVLRISDDGAGMDLDAIRAKAVERGLLEPGADITDSDVTQFVLQTGFTTASEVTQISGRGVGLDVVNSEVKQLGGSLHIESARGSGTVFTIRLPYTLAINQALLVKAGTDTYCVPLGNVEGVVRVHPQDLLACYMAEEPVYEYAGDQYQLKHLATLLNTDQLDANQMPARVPLLLLRLVDKRIALHVESLLGSREIVIKPVGVQLSGIDGISGATILGDGSVAMILDVFSLSRSNSRANLPVMKLVSRDEKRLVVMVVDDSITVRKVTTRLLERNGYKVLTAKDGVDATGQLQGCTPDIMLLDIEMPRMDGFELATHMRNDERLRHVPVIMITSRTGDKHRERARQIGVNYYLGKPYQEKDLLGTIDKIIRVTPDCAAANHAEA
jgi:chemosensory pili system protein ChpA (sensor histidine kinase/response regulator)